MQSRSIAGLDAGSAHTLARGLGWFSIALGVTELVASHSLARSLGLWRSEPLLKAYGVREIATGIGVLSAQNPAPWIWARVGGDALDIATLATGARSDNPKSGNLGVALASVLGVTLLDVVCASALSAGNGQQPAIRDYSDRRGMPEHIGKPARPSRALQDTTTS